MRQAARPLAARPLAALPLSALPLSVGPVTLRNRIASAPMERNYCDTDGRMTEVYRHYLRERADAGVALVMTEASYIRPDGKGRSHQLGVHDDDSIDGLRMLAADMHERGALLGVQLNHAGGTAQTKTSLLPTVAPSPVGVAVAGGQVPRALSTDEVYELAADFALAAARCVAAGVDVLSIHSGHGYLVHQFMSPLSNHRDDEFSDPVRFLNLVIDGVRAAAPEVALGLRLSVIEGAPGGLDAEQTLAIIDRAHLDRIDFLDLSAGSYAAGEWIVQSGEWQPGLLSDHARAYRRYDKPLSMAGRLNSPEIIEQVIADGTCDFVSLARALHADPAFATACLDGTPYRPCIACNVCIDNLGQGAVGCSVNPTVGRGTIPLPTPAVRPLRAPVTVIGAGPAGLTVARELATAGAEVTVVDKSSQLGGRMAFAADMKSTPDFGRYLEWSLAELTRLGVTVKLGADPSSSASGVVIDAAGDPVAPTPHADTVIDATEWLAGREPGHPLPACTIWGADTIGMSLADTLAAEGTAVLLIGSETEIAPSSGRRGKILAVPRLRDNPNVRVRLDSELLEVQPGRVLVRGLDGAEEWLDAPGPVLDTHQRGGGARSIRDAVLSGYDTAQHVAGELAR